MRKSTPQIVVLIILLVAGYFIFKPNMDENYSQTNYYLGTVNTGELKMRKSTPQIVVLIILLVAGYFIFKPNMDENYSQTNYYLGTVNTVTVYGKKQKKAMEILNGCDEVVKVVDNLMSTEIPGSDVSKINKNAGIKPVKVSPETYEVVKEAIKYSKLSDGNFDVSIGPVSDLWSIGKKDARVPEKKVSPETYEVVKEAIKYSKLSDGNFDVSIGPVSDLWSIGKKDARVPEKSESPETYEVVKEAIKYSKLSDGNFDVSIGPVSDLWSIGKKDARVPEKSEIDALLPLIDYKNVEAKEIKLETDQDGDGKNETFDKEYTVFLKKKGMKIDLGAIAKGFAADQVALYLKASDVEKAIINLGGNIKTIGDFNIGLKNPIENANDSFASVKVSNKSVVTSGVYERFVEKDGKKYHHILNPADGYPFDNNLLSVSIISDKSRRQEVSSYTKSS